MGFDSVFVAILVRSGKRSEVPVVLAFGPSAGTMGSAEIMATGIAESAREDCTGPAASTGGALPQVLEIWRGVVGTPF
jgi:hypothetical protein